MTFRLAKSLSLAHQSSRHRKGSRNKALDLHTENITGNSGNEVLGRLYAVASLGEFVAQILRTLAPEYSVPLRMKRTPDVPT